MDKKLAALMTAHECEAVHRPLETAMTLPAQAFNDEAWFALEKDRVMARNWMGVLFSCEVDEIGDVHPFDYLDMPLLAIRGTDGRLRMFHNIVPYDGCLVAQTRMSGVTEIETFYHGLRYDLNGKLTAAPFWNARADCDRKAFGDKNPDLAPIACEERMGVVFINMSGTAAPIDEMLAPWRKLVGEHYAIDRLVPARDASGKPLVERRVIKGNWKTYQENASINQLHASFTHAIYRNSPDVPRVDSEGNPLFSRTVDGPVLAFQHLAKNSAKTFEKLKLATAGHDPERMPDWGFFTTIYPNVNAPLLEYYIKVNLSIPIAPGLTETAHLRFFAPEALKSEAFQNEETVVLKALFDEVHQEDTVAIEAVQSARRSPAFRQHYYAPFWDQLHHRFNQLVLEDMERGD
ncbi:MAG: SRPBCC family protein [Albidovulum sp.]|uniref:aromatic ring-hydroxylating oxygenase subunit alpha n=1 Tax=Albidovulum sp. TaxID=1872424 RepID=UPI003C8E29A3